MKNKLFINIHKEIIENQLKNLKKLLEKPIELEEFLKINKDQIKKETFQNIKLITKTIETENNYYISSKNFELAKLLKKLKKKPHLLYRLNLEKLYNENPLLYELLVLQLNKEKDYITENCLKLYKSAVNTISHKKIIDIYKKTFYFVKEQGEQVFLELNTNELERQIDAINVYNEKNELPNNLKPIRKILGSDDEMYNQLTLNQSINYGQECITKFDWKILKDENRDGSLEQRNFVSKAINTPDFAILEGPPGSGKTTVILELILQLIEQDKRILLTSATHVAIDNVLERLAELNLNQLLAIRISADQNKITSNKVKENFIEDVVLNKILKATENRLNNIEIPLTEGQKMLRVANASDPENIEFKNFILNNANLVAGTLIGILQHRAIKEPQIDFEPFDYLIVDEASKVTLSGFLVPAQFASKWIIVGDTKQLPPFNDETSLKLSLLSKLSANNKNFKDICIFIDKLARDYQKKGLNNNSIKKIFEEFKHVDKESLEIIENTLITRCAVKLLSFLTVSV